MLYPRDPSRDPQLVWKGKDEQDQAVDQVVLAPVCFISDRDHVVSLDAMITRVLRPQTSRATNSRIPSP